MASTGIPAASSFDAQYAAGAVAPPGGPWRRDPRNVAPSFGSTSFMDRHAYKLVVPSWMRKAPCANDTNAFTVDVSYAPMGYVTRTQLVDVDIPNTQRLIERDWSRVYFDMGIVPSTACREVTVIVASSARNLSPLKIPVVLPLPLDTVVSYELIAQGIVRVFLGHGSPTPIVVVAGEWARFPSSLRLIGIPTIGMLVLDARNVRPNTAVSFDILSLPVWEALADAESPVQLYVTAGPVPGPTALANVVEACVRGTLRSMGIPITVQLQYDRGTDTFVLQTEELVSVAFRGPVGTYMGEPHQEEFGHAVGASGMLARVLAPPCRGTSRYVSACGYADVNQGTPESPDALAAWIQAAFNAGRWQAFQFGITFPGLTGLPPISVPGGYMTLAEVAVAIQAATDAFAASTGTPLIAVTICTSGPDKSGVVFECSAAAFGLDFTVDTAHLDAVRLGYDPTVYTPSTAHFPVRNARHIPLLEPACNTAGGCGSTTSAGSGGLIGTLPPADAQVLLQPGSQLLSITAVARLPFQAQVSAGASPGKVTVVATNNWQANMIVGEYVAVAFGTGSSYTQIAAVVVDANLLGDLTSFDMAFIDPEASADLPPLPTNVTIVPQTRPPLDLYLQPPTTPFASLYRKLHGVDAPVFGFLSLTYESPTGTLTSPGTVKICQDAQVVLCLGFSAAGGVKPGTGTRPNTGSLFYPWGPGQTWTAFAKILRGIAFLRADFLRVFDYTFAGEGQTLTNISVAFYNANGTPYQTHGHPTSVTLQFECRAGSVEFGGGTAVLPMDGTGPLLQPIARGTLLPGLMSFSK